MDSLLRQKLNDIETLPIQQVYQMAEFKRDSDRIYNEALGLRTKEDKRNEQKELQKRCANAIAQGDNILKEILEEDNKEQQ